MKFLNFKIKTLCFSLLFSSAAHAMTVKPAAVLAVGLRGMSNVQAVKQIEQKWLTYANDLVSREVRDLEIGLKPHEAEMAKSFACQTPQFAGALSDPLLIERLRVQLVDHITNEVRTQYDDQVQQAMMAFIAQDKTALSPDRAKFQQIAAQVFQKYPATVFNDPLHKICAPTNGDMAVIGDFKNNMASFMFDFSYFKNRHGFLEESLFHERSHIIHKDVLVREVFRRRLTIAGCPIVEAAVNTLNRSMETRADTYAALYSQSNGRHFVEQLKESKMTGISPGTHPSYDDRIKHFQSIQADIGQASKV